MAEELTHAQTTALWTAAFFDELVRCGVRAAVISPGSRSTPLAMTAFELNRRRPDDLRIFVDVDERGAAFLGLGMAKATGRPVALICTSGTATANYYPAIIEAETSRVPLIALTGDRPPRLQGLGAPQTTDQLKLYGDHVRAFRAMPLPDATPRGLAFVRQAAREACLAAVGGTPQFAPGEPYRAEGSSPSDLLVASCGSEALAGPVQVNFPFDEPLKPDFPGADAWAAREEAGAWAAHHGGVGSTADLFAAGRPAGIVPVGADGSAARSEELLAGVGGDAVPLPLLGVQTRLDSASFAQIAEAVRTRRVLVLAGEGTCSTLEEAREVAAWAHRLRLPLLADPLSGLRCVDADEVIDAYDNVFGREDCPLPDAVIRFGRYPVSKRTTTRLAQARPFNIVVDAGQTRDFNAATDLFAPLAPLAFVRSWADEPAGAPANALAETAWEGVSPEQEGFCQEWIAANAAARNRIDAALADADDNQGAPFEGSVVRTIFDLAPAGSCLFVANSMAVRALDTVQPCGDKPFCVLANRGQNGIDGTVSTAVGAAQRFAQTTFVTGDLTLLHDLNALALQNELLANQPGTPPSLVIVLLNNDGGAIFDMLPQALDEPYFPRVFLTPQNVDFEQAAAAFHVPYRRAHTIAELRDGYRACLGAPGISLIEVRVPLRGVKERYGACWE